MRPANVAASSRSIGTSNAIVLCALTLLGGCDGGLQLVVDVRTDFRPGLEFTHVRTEIISAAETPGGVETSRSALIGATSAQDFLSGRRVADFELATTGTFLVRASLLDIDGRLVIARDTRVTVTESFGMTVLLTRSCQGVACPRPGDDPEATTCLGGGCVSPDCSLESPEACGAPECDAHSDCSSLTGCAEGQCLDGFCLQVPIPGACERGEWCSIERGCIDLPGEGDAGTPACVPEAELCNGTDDDCDGTTDEGFDLTSDPSNCGTCGTMCGGDHATASCMSGACVLECDSGWSDCNGEPADGCEADLNAGTSCGSCVMVCVDPAPLCVSDGIDYMCASSCPSESPTLCGASCVDLDASLAHCGACGASCDPAAATGACTGGACTIASCDPGRADCNSDASDGCESSLSDATSCGACGTSCAAASPYCVPSGPSWSCTHGCGDGVRGGDETDVDCGGTLCPACSAGELCGGDADCSGTLRCTSGVCMPCGECAPAAMDTGSCGMCGTRSRTCNAGCVWNSWGSCTSEGECSVGAMQSRACGNCGMQTRVCSGSCTWGGWGACSGEGACSPGAMGSQACGNCGTQSRTCSSLCAWNVWSGCSGEGPCSPGSTTTSGCPGPCMEQSCTSLCEWDNDCDGCSSSCSSSYGECGSSCTMAGYHVTTRLCSTSCGGSTCISLPDNRVQCGRSCGASFSGCGTSCPVGYYASSLSCSTGCTSSSSCISQPDNRAQCNLIEGSSFGTCGTTCPSGYYISSRSCSTSCTSSSSCISQPDNRSQCNLVQGSSFTTCGSSCPAGYVVSSRLCTTSCTSSSSCISQPDNAVRCNRL